MSSNTINTSSITNLNIIILDKKGNIVQNELVQASQIQPRNHMSNYQKASKKNINKKVSSSLNLPYKNERNKSEASQKGELNRFHLDDRSNSDESISESAKSYNSKSFFSAIGQSE